MDQFFSLSGLINAVVSIFFGFIVLLKNTSSIINRTFFLFCLSVTVWSIPYYFWPIAENKESALLWFQLLHIGASFTSVTYLHFVITWLDIDNKKNKFIVFTGYCLALFFSLSVFSELFIQDMIPKFKMSYWAEPGMLYHFYLLYFLSYAFYSSYLLFKSYRNSFGKKRSQIRLILIGMVLAYLGGSTNYPLWYDINFPPYGTILVLSYVVLTAYAIIAHRLMDIKFVLRRYAVYLVSVILVFLPLIAIEYLVDLYLPFFVSFIDVAVLFLAISVFPLIKKLVYRLSNKFFFSSLYDDKKVIAKLSDNLRSTLNVEQVYGYIYTSLNEAMHVKSFGVLLYDDIKKHYSTEFSIGFNIDRKINFEKNELILKYFLKENKPLIIAELDGMKTNPRTKKVFEILEEMRVKIIIPLSIKNNIVGAITMGAKESGDMYNDIDLQVLEIISSQSAMAIENAMLYEKTKNFSVKMEEEVKNATVELRAANKKLKKLDIAKSEFISIASHQLRTPLTVIKGYISMMIEGSFGEVNEKIRKSLEKVYDSNERLINLVENLLNISRIESGRLKFDYQTVQFEDVIESVIDELAGTAIDKGIQLEFQRQPSVLAKVTIDVEKMRQVVMNLIDNAIKYTEHGKVLVLLRRENRYLVFCVSDSGLGILKDDLPKLFKKFVRGNNAMLTHTEGTGLGLFVAKQMVEFHNGKIWAESDGGGERL